MSAEFRKEPIGTASLLVTLLFGGWTLYATYFQGPRITVHFGSEVLLMGYDRIGIPCVFTNSGAKPGVIAGLAAGAGGEALWADRLSVGTDTFAMAGGRLQEASRSTFEYFRPILVPGHGDATAVVWFVGDTPLIVKDATTQELQVEVAAYFGPGSLAAREELRFPISPDLMTCIKRSEEEWHKSAKPAKSDRPDDVYRECSAATAGWAEIFARTDHGQQLTTK